MSEASQYLRRVKSDFEDHGVRNEVQITEHVAFLLLIPDHWEQILQQGAIEAEPLLRQLHHDLEREHRNLRIPQPPPVQQWGREPLNLIWGLRAAFESSPHNSSWGDFFQREIRFELLKGSSGSQYPTPSHVADFMVALALNNTGVGTVFDPTAGSGGLLAAYLSQVPDSSLTACDLDPQWAAIGSANLILNGTINASYHVGSVLEYIGSRRSSRDYRYRGNVDRGFGDSWTQANNDADDLRFNAILMNPPFGGSRNAYEVNESVGPEYGRSNATVLTALALQSLQPGGRAAVLVPSGVLFGGGGEANLRQALARQNLEAIIRMPKGAFQPYSQVGANLIVFQNWPQEGSVLPSPVWFLAPNGDGYDPGMGRDLTAEPLANNNDLPRVCDLILQTRTNQWQTRLSFESGKVQTSRQQDEAGLPSVAVRVVETDESTRWKAAFLTDGLFVSLANSSNLGHGWLFEPLDGQGQLAFSILPDDAPIDSWTNLVAATSWATYIPDTWQGDQDDISLTINNQTGFSLNKYDFSDQSQPTVQASLLNEQGNPLTPWLGCDDAKLVDALDTEPEKNKLKAVVVRDGHGKRCGWLIDLTANTENESGEAPIGFLLLREGDEVLPFGENGRFYLTLDTGWITFTPAANPQIAFHIGQAIILPNDRRIDGFAVGPGIEGAGHHLFGLLVARSEFVDTASGNVGDLRPTRFFPEPETAALDAPADLLAHIRRNQEELKDRVDVLLRALGKQSAPNPQVAELPSWMTQILGIKQRTFWNILAQHTVDSRPAHFTIEHVKRWCADDSRLNYQEDDIQKQLDLFASLGLIQHVHVKGDEREGDFYENLYRAITKGDVLSELKE